MDSMVEVWRPMMWFARCSGVMVNYVPLWVFGLVIGAAIAGRHGEVVLINRD